jgi:hypothetical protein
MSDESDEGDESDEAKGDNEEDEKKEDKSKEWMRWERILSQSMKCSRTCRTVHLTCVSQKTTPTARTSCVKHHRGVAEACSSSGLRVLLRFGKPRR